MSLYHLSVVCVLQFLLPYLFCCSMLCVVAMLCICVVEECLWKNLFSLCIVVGCCVMFVVVLCACALLVLIAFH